MAEARVPWRVPAPSADAFVRWPADWGARFLVTVDVEEEFDWRAPLSRAARATTAMHAFPDAHRRFRDAGVPLACMVDHPITQDPGSVDMLRDVVSDGRSEIGAQLHAWVNPPFAEAHDLWSSYPGNLPEALESAKLDTLTEAIERAFGHRPRAYRAGRYGIGANTRRLLASRDYLIDSSVRARYDYRRQLGPDFGAVGNHAHRVDGVVELPLTTVHLGRWRGGGERLHRLLSRAPKGRAASARLGLLSRVALTPEDMPIGPALAAVDAALADGVRLLVFSFHSPSLSPGHTPYVADAADLRRFWAWWTAMLARLDRCGVRAASLADVVDATR